MSDAAGLLLLVLSLPTTNTAARMRAWRALKAAGAAVLRDGVYALPAGDERRALLQQVAADVRANDGSARLLDARLADGPVEPLFDRGAEFAALLAEMQAAGAGTAAAGNADPVEPLRAPRRLRRAFEQLAAIDFFPGEAQRQAAEALAALEARLARLATPNEPQPRPSGVPAVRAPAYRGRVWASRARPWVDRLACAWLIRRHIDAEARFVWLADTARLPRGAVGFDFDGAQFSHVGARVSFETLLAAFDLETPTLLRLGTLVHALDAGGVMPPEAAGVERVLAGMREAIADDDALMVAAAGVFEGLYRSFETDAAVAGKAGSTR